MKALFSSLFNLSDPRLEKDFCGLKFPNPVGLAAGFDKDAKALHSFARMGFGFVEVGTVTPLAQVGNDKPRLFRLPKDKGLINRMGFNNEGITPMVERLKNRPKGLIVGGNIGKNKNTPNELAYSDYEKCIDALFPYVDYFAINISSPNTPGLRELQEKEPLRDLLTRLRKKVDEGGSGPPLLLKVAPDLTNEQLDDIAEIVLDAGIDGIIATNTTINRSGLKTEKDKVDRMGAGGLSGLPVIDRSDEVISYLRKKLGPDYPIIGVGGITSPEDALRKLKAGADLIQIYTGFIYEGPSFIKRINKAIIRDIKQ